MTKPVAVIPARGGSKRIPRKNLKEFFGNPIIFYPIQVAIQSKLFGAVYVSTEDNEIAQVARDCGAEVIPRNSSLADDFTPTVPVIRHAIKYLVQKGECFDEVCCIYPTMPFLEAHELITGYQLIRSGKWKFVFSAVEFEYPIQRAFRISSAGQVSMFDDTKFSSRTQDLESSYHDADKFYWGSTDAWLSETTLFSSSSTAVIVPRGKTVSIDTEEDWQAAEQLFGSLN